MTVKLSNLKVGDRVVICDIAGDEELRKRMHAMGLRAGREASVMRRGRLGGPLQIRVGSINLVVRRSDAERVHVSFMA